MVAGAAPDKSVPTHQVHPHPSELMNRHLMNRRLDIHFHTWTPMSYLRMLLHLQDNGMPIELELIQQNEVEFLTVLRKTTRSAA